MILQTTLDIARTPSAVFDFLADQSNWGRVDPALVELQPRGRLALAQTGTVTRRVTGMRVTTKWSVTEFDPGSRLTILITGRGYELRETTSLAAAPAGTRATVVDELTPTSLVGRVMTALSGGIVLRDLHARAGRLKALLEA